MTENPLVANQVLLGESAYATAIDIVIAKAESELMIFDDNLEKGDYQSLNRFHLMHNFLSKNPQSKLTIILHRVDFFKKDCPRLLSLLKVYSHKMTVYTSNNEAKIAKDTLVIADKKHYVRRFHIDQARFKYHLDDVESSASIVSRFNALLEHTQETITSTNLGL